MCDLAIFTGQPAFVEPLHVGRPNVGNRERMLQRMEDILDRRWFTNDGPLVREFEARIADLLGVRHCVAMCNATVALEITVRAMGLRGEVIIPSFTFIATAHALQWQGITPVFCDVDPKSHNLDPRKLEELITPRTSGILGVHLWGRGCQVPAITEVAERHGLQLLFDAAHAFACRAEGRWIGGFGRAEVFSFHATKFINSFEGGAVTTNDDELAERIRLMRNFGFAGLDQVVYLGVNGKMSEASAAMGLTSLESLEKILQINLRNHAAYRAGLQGVPALTVLAHEENQANNHQYVVVELDPDCPLSRDEVVAVLKAENVLARRYFTPGCHAMEPYRSYYPYARHLLPVTCDLVQRVLQLPTGEAISTADIGRICEIIRTAVAEASRVKRRLSETFESVPSPEPCVDEEEVASGSPAVFAAGTHP